MGFCERDNTSTAGMNRRGDKAFPGGFPRIACPLVRSKLTVETRNNCELVRKMDWLMSFGQIGDGTWNIGSNTARTGKRFGFTHSRAIGSNRSGSRAFPDVSAYRRAITRRRRSGDACGRTCGAAATTEAGVILWCAALQRAAAADRIADAAPACLPSEPIAAAKGSDAIRPWIRGRSVWRARASASWPPIRSRTVRRPGRRTGSSC